MKRICSLALCLVMVMSTVLGVNISVTAADKSSEDLNYINQNLGWQPGDTEWQKDFYCEIDGDNIILCWYQGDATDTLNIPDEAVVDGHVLKTKLEDDCSGLLGSHHRADFKTINFGEHIDTSNVTDMHNMFSYCRSLENLDISCFDTSNVLKMDNMFCGCSSIETIDLSNIDTGNVSNMAGMFSGCSSLTSLDLSKMDTSNVTVMTQMFLGCSNLASLDLSSLNTGKLTNMSGMFKDCDNLKSINFGNINTQNVKDMSSLFENCSSLTEIDLSSFDTRNVETMLDMFYKCSGLTSLNVSKFNTSKVTNMCGMFYQCSGLTSLDLSGFDTSHVTDMRDMFYKCSGITSLDLHSFKTEAVKFLGNMFEGCSNLVTLDVNGWNPTNVTNMEKMFYGCQSLSGLDMSTWNINCNGAYSRDVFTGCYDLKWIIVPKFVTSVCTIMLPSTFVRKNNSSVEYTELPDQRENYNMDSWEGNYTIITKDQMIPATGISITPKTQAIDEGDSFTISATITPADASNKKVTWSSSDTNIATVDETGKVVGVGEGTVTITGKTVDGGYSDSCVVTVSKGEEGEKKDPTVNPPRAKTNLIYTGKALALADPGTTNGGTLQYGLGTAVFEPTSWSEAVPTATEVGTYYVWYKIVGDDNYNDVPPAYIGTPSRIEDEEVKPESDNVVSVDEIAGTAIVNNEYTGRNDKVDIDIIEQSDIYRMYNPITAEHLYTKDAGEVVYLQAIGWNHETESDYTVVDARDSDAIPVYRLFNPYTDTHHYTESVDEVRYDVSLGWVYERISHYVYDKNSDKGTPQWRLYTTSGPHNWTSDQSEISWLESMGWINEGIRWRIL